jgi:glutathione S-transferase
VQLIIAKPSPFARKVRIALREKDIPYEEVVSNPWNADALAPTHNPLGKVPVLLLEDGSAIYESHVIVDYLETLNGPSLMPPAPEDAISARQIDALAMGICDAVVLLVLEGQRPAKARSVDWIARQNAKVAAGVAGLSDSLAGRDWSIGDGLTLADISAGCALAYLDLRLPGFEWRDRYLDLVRYSEKLEARSSFAETRPEAQAIVPLA